MKIYDGREFDIPEEFVRFAQERHYRFLDEPFKMNNDQVSVYPVGIKWRELKHNLDDFIMTNVMLFIIRFSSGRIDVAMLNNHNVCSKEYTTRTGKPTRLFLLGHCREWEEQFND